MRPSVLELERMLQREKRTRIICSELSNCMDLKPALSAVVEQVKELTGCEAVGIRLHDDGDYPYYVYSGFPESFIELENNLCATDGNGDRIRCRDADGYLLECMCGNIIRGRFDPSLRFFTVGGSFWSNTTTALLASTCQEERQIQPRKTCSSWGYESVALIPIKARGERIGLIQLNDKRIGMFTPGLIEYLEMIAEQIGLAVQASLTDTHLKDALEQIKALRKLLPTCVSCNKVRDGEGNWKAVEARLRDPIEAEFLPSLCQDCLRQLCGEPAPDGLAPVGEQVADAVQNARVYEMAQQELAERKRIEEALRESEREYRALIEEAPIGLCSVDIRGKVTRVNKRFEQVSGYSREEVVGKSGFELGMFSPLTLKLFAERIKSRLRGQPGRRLETRFKCKDGRWIWVAIEARVIKKRGLPVGFQLASRDITERKKAEQALKEYSERLEEMVEERTKALREGQERLLRKEKLPTGEAVAGL